AHGLQDGVRVADGVRGGGGDDLATDLEAATGVIDDLLAHRAVRLPVSRCAADGRVAGAVVGELALTGARIARIVGAGVVVVTRRVRREDALAVGRVAGVGRAGVVVVARWHRREDALAVGRVAGVGRAAVVVVAGGLRREDALA